MNKRNLDHADIVTSHKCNNNCTYCIDKFIHSSENEISLETIDWFLRKIRRWTDEPLEILLLGGEPTMLSEEKLIQISFLIHCWGFRAIMSTNGIQREKIKNILPYYDSIQVTVNNDAQIDYWRDYPHKINIKVAGDGRMTMEKLRHFIDVTTQFDRRSVSMYFTEDFEELCKDKEIWELLDTFDWKQNGSYMYAFYEGVRFKKCIHGYTNIADEPTVPKVYPNGNYNKTWKHEEMDAYLD